MADKLASGSTVTVRSDDPTVFTNPDVLSHLAKVVWQDVDGNLAFTTESPKVAAAQTAWARQMPPTIFELVEGRLYHASGFQLCSTLIVVGDDGLTIVDPGENDDRAAATREVFAQFSDLPVKGVVYTHRHPDHAFGAAGWGVTQEQVDSGEVKIIASENFVPNLVEDTGVVGPILTQRTAYSGPYLGPGEDGWITIGLGPDFRTGPLSLFMPNVLVDEFEPLEVTVAGESMVVFGAYGDAGTDEICLYLPEHRHVHGSETIQGETFPNLYTLRGTGYRNPTLWYKGIDRLLPYARKADSYSGSHMRAWVGNDFIVERVTNYRDAIQYVHDQTVHHINRGYKLDQLAEAVVLPHQFAQDPWLMEFYGSVAHSVRNIYAGLIGWFQGDATELARPGFFELSRKYVAAMGGRDQVLALARQAVADEEFGWSAELLTHVTRENPDDKEARDVKAEALRQWGYLQTNIYWRTLALSAAGELDGTLDRSAPWNFADPVIVAALPTTKILDTFRVRLNAERATGKEIVIGLDVTDTGEKATYHVRNQVAVFHDTAPDAPDATVRATKAAMLQMFATGKAPEHTVAGSEAAVAEFLHLLDTFEPNKIDLVLPND
ncbi:alkyl sulfatase dimerization domain-containing protein [Isoptericola haloaureus]|uniref:Alkyl sulfatase dimerization domain-containing protein n=1 Tax=Isoptericola haloaureus TaxID=1542902 RepID=A0ABU7Z6P9_9MICO